LQQEKRRAISGLRNQVRALKQKKLDKANLLAKQLKEGDLALIANAKLAGADGRFFDGWISDDDEESVVYASEDIDGLLNSQAFLQEVMKQVEVRLFTYTFMGAFAPFNTWVHLNPSIYGCKCTHGFKGANAPFLFHALHSMFFVIGWERIFGND